MLATAPQHYYRFSVEQLRSICRERGIRGYSRKSKHEIINLIIQAETHTRQNPKGGPENDEWSSFNQIMPAGPKATEMTVGTNTYIQTAIGWPGSNTDTPQSLQIHLTPGDGGQSHMHTCLGPIPAESSTEPLFNQLLAVSDSHLNDIPSVIVSNTTSVHAYTPGCLETKRTRAPLVQSLVDAIGNVWRVCVRIFRCHISSCMLKVRLMCRGHPDDDRI
jgi:hypothetical protein